MTTRQIVTGAHVCAVNSIIAELRANGCVIHCERETAGNGRRRWRYTLQSSPPDWRRGHG
ncbi:MAG: hypothetical protein JJ894_03315 [Dinoroseobacter sp.]|nr:hypothetical protein [Dinoroseobacter sp.]